MRSKPPRVATWLLEHFRSGSGNDCIVGDLVEAHQGGRSRAWYWRQVLTAILVSFCQEIVAHPVLALRAISVGWASWFLFYYGFGPKLLRPFVMRFFVPSGFPFTPSTQIWWTAALLVLAASGWIVARLHRPHRNGMVLVFAASVFIFRLRMLPWIGSLAADTLTNSRFLPYLLFNLEALFLPSLAILFGGLWGASSESESKVRQRRSAV
jgi:hypothetical protein